MKFYFPALSISILVLSLSSVLKAQSKPGDDIFITAMQDELNRNMSELNLPNAKKPFYIMYGLRDQKVYSIGAALGALLRSAENVYRMKTNTRVLVGDYSFNDESLEGNNFSPYGSGDLGLPMDDDYLGIRRSFWSSTDNVYRSAARKFEQNQATFAESSKTLEEFPHRSFAKSEAIRLVETREPLAVDKKAWETKVKNLSALFIPHPFVKFSSVYIVYGEGHDYIVTSEGTVVKVPVNRATFTAMVQATNSKGDFLMDQVTHYASTPDQLPSEQFLADEIKDMIKRLETAGDLPVLDEEYSGPVLVTGPAVAEVFSTLLLRGKESLRASHDLPNSSSAQFNFNNEASAMDNKIGKPVVHESITVKAKPKMKTYNGQELMGAFQIDQEGIIPPDELLMVENGVLRNLLNDRTISKPSQTANGFSGGPGVLEITVAQKNSEKVLKEKLIEQAKKEGLDFAIIVRESPSMGMGTINVFKVSVADGKEELVRGATMSLMSLKILKRVLGASDKYAAHTVSGMSRGQGGGFTSVIVPDALLLEEMQLKPFKMTFPKEEDYVPSPLK